MKTASLLRVAAVLFCSPSARPWRRRKRPDKPQEAKTRAGAEHPAPAAGGFGQRKNDHHRARQAHLHRDRRHARLLRPAGQPERLGLLHRLCRERREPAGDLRFQRRSRRGLGLSASRPGRPAHSRTRARWPRRRARDLARQSGDLAALYRSGDDRSDRHRLEPRRQGRRRQGLLERQQRRQRHGQGDLALRHAQQPRRLAEIPARRKLRRPARGEDGARAAARSGRRRVRAHHAVAAAGRLADLRRRHVGAARGACNCRRWRRPNWSARRRSR